MSEGQGFTLCVVTVVFSNSFSFASSKILFVKRGHSLNVYPFPLSLSHFSPSPPLPGKRGEGGLIIGEEFVGFLRCMMLHAVDDVGMQDVGMQDVGMQEVGMQDAAHA